MEPGTWPNEPGPDEYALICDRGRDRRLLIVPALFDEGHKLRRFAVETMHALDRAGVDVILPDLPGTNESLVPLVQQSLESWRDAMKAAMRHFRATHTLSMRGGAVVSPPGAPEIRYAPTSGESMIRGLLRARVIADREAGIVSDREKLLAEGRRSDLQIAGMSLSSGMVNGLALHRDDEARTGDIAQSELGGPGLWLRAEATGDVEQAERLAHIVVERMA